jgi:hypothetical protein
MDFHIFIATLSKTIHLAQLPPLTHPYLPNHAFFNNAAATQSHIGWPNFLKGHISNEWANLWTKYMRLPKANTCECALIQALWDHKYRLWMFHTNEDHKNDNRGVAQYKNRP